MGVVAISCGGPAGSDRGGAGDEDYVGNESFGLSKCKGGTNGDGDYCSSSCQCVAGEGDCDTNADCSGGSVCLPAKGLQFCLPNKVDVCGPSHCNNKKQDADETQPDCGGSCGTCCGTNTCLSNPPLGAAGHCTVSCPCAALEGGCSASTGCQAGLVCQSSPAVGAYFGWTESLGVCLASTCSNKVKDGDEMGTDCGGSCLPCTTSNVTSVGYGVGGNELVEAVAYDPSGNLYIAGRTSSSRIDFGCGALTLKGGSDIFLVKLDGSNACVWSKLIGGTGHDGDQSVTVATDASGNVILGGNFYTTVDFGGGAVAAVGTTDAFVAKYDSTGAYLWAKAYGGAGGANKMNDVWADPSGNVLLTGSFQKSINLGGSTFNAASASSTSLIYDMFVAKLSSSGAHVWSKAFGSAGNDEGVAITTDNNGYLYVGGLFSSSVSFTSTPLTSAGGTDAVALKLAPSGPVQWAKAFGAAGDDRMNAVAWGNNGNAVFAGNFKGTVNFGGGNVASKGSTDGFVVALTGAGAYSWSHGFGGTGADRTKGIAIRKTTSQVAVVGGFFNTVDFGGGNRVSAGNEDAFVVYYSSSGTYLFDATYGGTGQDAALANAIVQSTASYPTTSLLAIGGDYSSTPFTIGSKSLNYGGGNDAFVSRFVF
jgi:hypothetical protein